MKFIKNMVVMVSLITVIVCAKQMKRSVEQSRVPVTPAQPATPAVPKEWIASDITTLPAPLNQTPEGYAQNKVAAVSQQLINDIFPRTDTIERLVFAFR